MPNKPRIGIVGCGIISDLLLEGARCAGISVAAVCDMEKEKAKRAALPFGAQVYGDYHQMLERANLDGVIVALPSHLHFEAARDALDAGKHVFCEKTMTNSVQDSLKLARKAGRSGRVFQMGYMKRFNPAFAALKQNLGRIAPVTNATLRLTITSDPVLSGRKSRPSSWHSDVRKVGGGFLVHSGSHLLDLMMFYFGLPDCAWGTLSRDVNGNEFANDFLFRMRSGLFVNMQLLMTRARGFSHAGSEWEEKVEINGLNGRLSGEDADWMGKIPSRAFLHLADGQGPKALFTLWESQWAEELKAFVQGIREGRCLGSSAADGYRVDYILSRLKRFEKGKAILKFHFAL